MELLDRAQLIEGQGIAGDFRGTCKAGSNGQNGVVLLEAGDWSAASAECGKPVSTAGWYEPNPPPHKPAATPQEAAR